MVLSSAAALRALASGAALRAVVGGDIVDGEWEPSSPEHDRAADGASLGAVAAAGTASSSAKGDKPSVEVSRPPVIVHSLTGLLTPQDLSRSLGRCA